MAMDDARSGIEDVTYADRISELPNDLLFRILSLIPVSNAMSTSQLSKRWKPVWKMLSTLVYDENSCPNVGSVGGFVQFCGRSLQLHDAPLLKTLNLKLRKHSDSLDSLFSTPNNIQYSTLVEMSITSTTYPCYYSTISFPNLNVFQTLAVLKLQGHILVDVVESPVCFQSLKSLYLKCVKFESEDSFSTLLSACPVLEDLFIQRTCSVGSFVFTISVPSLQRLSFTKEQSYYADDKAIVEITAPSLKYLKIFDRVGCYSFVVDMSKLVEADVKVNLSKNEKLPKVLTSVEHLSLDLYPSMVFHLTDRFISKQLLHLELDIYDNFRSNLLMSLLKDLPSLRALKLNHQHPNYTVDDQPCSVSKPSSVPKCLSFHLETFEWIGYAGTYEEIEAAVYVLKNARCLKNATISLYSRGMENDQLMIKELESMSKASTMCQLLVKF
ncbi:PREDICTED: putative F-box/FBD/LRR-repeat protein At5g56810 [Camelina sativa]|uniref:F-box/FBD/LRR-repeat protein At5g56810 n=1 Tax=Camelina sativa TaxID=90675 RepID=A0ABM0UMJ3_CAMSA|nr:PREDICTED: putative F-box/FBD/LRR-repeat protein At5g56810 [Camelina sativa]